MDDHKEILEEISRSFPPDYAFTLEYDDKKAGIRFCPKESGIPAVYFYSIIQFCRKFGFNWISAEEGCWVFVKERPN